MKKSTNTRPILLHWKLRALWGGLGGLLALLARVEFEQQVPANVQMFGLWGMMHLAFYLIMGAVVAAAFEEETSFLKLLILGISAPAFVNGVSGYELAKQKADEAATARILANKQGGPNVSRPQPTTENHSESRFDLFAIVYASAQPPSVPVMSHKEASVGDKLLGLFAGTVPNKDYFVIANCQRNQVGVDGVRNQAANRLGTFNTAAVYRTPPNYSPPMYCLVLSPNATYDQANLDLKRAISSGWQDAYVWTFGLPLKESAPDVTSLKRAIKNFEIVNDHIYRGAQPSKSAIESLAAAGVTEIIDLRTNKAARDKEEQEVTKLGMHFEDKLPGIPENQVPPPGWIDALLQLLTGTSNIVFIHDESGTDRIGLVIACYRIRVEHLDNQEALKEARNFDLRNKNMVKYIESFH